MLVNDLIFDCPNQDDKPELLNESVYQGQRCVEQILYEYYPGHSRYYTKDQKCVYNLTLHMKTLMYYRIVQH